jgi:hypothetical protein
LTAPDQPDQEHRQDRERIATGVGLEDRTDPALPCGGADKGERDQVGEDEAQQQQVPLCGRVALGKGLAELAKQMQTGPAFAADGCGCAAVVGDRTRSVHVPSPRPREESLLATVAHGRRLPSINGRSH